MNNMINNLSKIKVICLAILSVAVFGQAKSSQATDFFIAQSQTGNNSATSCANAKSISWVSDISNWYDERWYPTGTIHGPGDTIHLCGTISSRLLIWKGGDGQTGEGHGALTIFFEPGAKMSAPVFPLNAIYIADYLSYITIDGGATGIIGGPNGNPGLANGIIENTANGTGLQYSQASSGIYALETSYLTIKNLVVRNLYVRTSTDDSINGTYSGGGGIGVAASNASFHDLIVTNNIVHDVETGISSDFGNNYNITYSYNTIYNVNWGAAIASRSITSSMSGFYLHDNYIHDMENWDDTTGQNAFHHNGFFGFVYNGGSFSDIYIYNNTVGPGFGVTNTTGMWLDTTGPGHGTISNANFFNNLVILGSNDWINNSALQGSSDGDTVFRFLNNTFVGGPVAIGGSTGNGGSIIVKNNLMVGSGHGVMFSTKCGQTGYVASNNLSYNLDPTYPYTCIDSEGHGRFYGLSQWQALTGQDLDVLTDNPLLDQNYRPQAGSLAIGAGVNLSSIGITSLNSDKNGVRRPASATWDIGAYKGGDTTAPAAPSGLTVN